jgi:AbrB family looped-hinge helix DNA binding protein
MRESNEGHRIGESTFRIVTIGAKGRVTIPATLRERFGLKAGTLIDWKAEQGRLVLTPVAEIEPRGRPGRGRKKN